MPRDTESTTIRFALDTRGVSEVIGSILVFGLLISLLSILQLQAIPQANEEVEFEHSQHLSDDMESLRVAISESAETGRTRQTTVKLGLDYPPRLIFYNPPAARGTLRTSEPAALQIENAHAEGNLGVYLQTDPQLDTRALNYTITYNEMTNAPTRVMELGVYYEVHEDEVLVRESSFIDDTEISLVALGGDYSESSVTGEKIEATPLSGPIQTYQVEADSSSDPITITIPTHLPAEDWDEILATEYTDTTSPLTGASVPGGGHVADATYTRNPTGPNTLTVTLETGVEYTMRMGKIGFGRGGDPSPRYIVPVEDDDSTVATVEVRDTFNNPVSGVELEIGGTSDTVTTGPDGRAKYAPASGSLVTFQKDFDGSGTATTPLEKVEVSTQGPPDKSDPGIAAFDVTVDTTQTCDSLDTVTGGSALICTGSFRTLQQPIVDFNATDTATGTESGIAYVEIQILDSGGDLITSRRFDGDGQAIADSRWVGPWLDDGSSPNRPNPTSVKLIVVDRSGRSTSQTKSL